MHTAKYIYKYTNRHLAYGIALIVLGLGTIAIPFCPSIYHFTVVACCMGISNAFTDSATILNVLQLFSQKSIQQLQTVYFFYAFGTFIGPFLAGKFLPSKSNSLSIFNGPSFRPEENPYQLIYIPYAISGALLLLSSLVLFAFHFIKVSALHCLRV
jgi:MFS family permease